MRSEARHGSARCTRATRGWLAAAASLGALLVTLLHAGEARAQAAGEPPPPPPGFEQQQQPPPPPPYPGGYPPGYPPPPGYYPPPGYSIPPAALIGPRTLDYEDGEPVPPGYHVDTRIRKGLLIGGAVTFGALYLISAATASAAQDTGDGDEFAPLYIPAVGPFVTIGTTNSQGAGTFLLIVDGVAQSGGLLMAILGLALPETLLVRNDVGQSTPAGAGETSASGASDAGEGASVGVAPIMVGGGTLGFGLVGRM
jgi:hypothetical protein